MQQKIISRHIFYRVEIQTVKKKTRAVPASLQAFIIFKLPYPPQKLQRILSFYE
jgi:hypothetical protein